MNKTFELFTDGAARGNPGPASIGAVLKNPSGENVAEISEYLGETTNNQAEYRALLAGLQKALELTVKKINVFLDSELVVKQLKGEYKVKHPDLIPLFEEIKLLIRKFPEIQISHVRREKNKEADKLANLALDKLIDKKS